MQTMNHGRVKKASDSQVEHRKLPDSPVEERVCLDAVKEYWH